MSPLLTQQMLHTALKTVQTLMLVCRVPNMISTQFAYAKHIFVKVPNTN